MAQQNHYDVLGVPKNADVDTIKKAFRDAAMLCHPDRNPGDKIAEAKFKAINDAYQVLGVAEKRAIYDGRATSKSVEGLNEAAFRRAFERFPEDILEHSEKLSPRSDASPMEALYHNTIEEAFSRLDRETVFRFFIRGGFGGRIIQVEFKPILTADQVTRCMDLWDKRVENAMRTLAERTESARAGVISTQQYLQELAKAREGSPSKHNPLVYVGRLEKKVSRISDAAISKFKKRRARECIHDWSHALLDVERGLMTTHKVFPSSSDKAPEIFRPVPPQDRPIRGGAITRLRLGP